MRRRSSTGSSASRVPVGFRGKKDKHNHRSGGCFRTPAQPFFYLHPSPSEKGKKRSSVSLCPGTKSIKTSLKQSAQSARSFGGLGGLVFSSHQVVVGTPPNPVSFAFWCVAQSSPQSRLLSHPIVLHSFQRRSTSPKAVPPKVGSPCSELTGFVFFGVSLPLVLCSPAVARVSLLSQFLFYNVPRLGRGGGWITKTCASAHRVAARQAFALVMLPRSAPTALAPLAAPSFVPLFGALSASRLDECPSLCSGTPPKADEVRQLHQVQLLRSRTWCSLP